MRRITSSHAFLRIAHYKMLPECDFRIAGLRTLRPRTRVYSRQYCIEDASRSEHTVYANTSTLRLHNALYQRKPEAGTLSRAFLGTVQSVKIVKQQRKLFRRDARAIIGHLHAKSSALIWNSSHLH